MKPSSLNTAVGVLFAVAGTVPGANAAGLKRFGRSTHQHDPRGHHHAAECSLEVITITTTLDITTTITAAPSDVPSSTNMPEVVNTTCSDEHQGWNTSITSTVLPTFLSTGVVASSTSEPCTDMPDPTWGLNSTITTSTTSQTTDEPCTDDVSSTVAPTVTLSMSSHTKEPCTDDESTTTGSSSTVDPTMTSVTSSTMTEPCDDDDVSSTTSTTADATMTSVTSMTTTEPCDDDESSTSSSSVLATLTESSSSITVTPFSTVTSTATSSQTTVYSVDTSMTPITTAVANTVTEIVTNTLPPTTTVCATSAPTGTPAPRAVHCGVRGLAVGDFFLGRYVEERAGVAVSLEACWTFCKTAWGATNGCSSYDYYINELGAPRCDLYSLRVAFALDRVDHHEPNLWFDLECGNPTDPKWTHSQPQKRSIRGGSRRA